MIIDTRNVGVNNIEASQISANSAKLSETNAASSATNAATQATNASTSASNAKTSETNAAASATQAQNVLNTINNISITDVVQSLGSVNGTLSIDGSLGELVTLTISGSITISLVSNSTTNCRTITLIITNGGSSVITWNTSIKWSGGVPTLSTSGIDILTFTTVDNGTTWYGLINGTNFS